MNRFYMPRLRLGIVLLLCALGKPANAAPPAPGATTRPAGTLLQISGEVAHVENLTADALAAMTHEELKVKDREGKEVVDSGVAMDTLLSAAGVSLGTGHGPNPALSMYVIVEAADGYKCVFSVAELDEKLTGRKIILVDRHDGKPLDAKEGPLRLIVPHDSRPVRWVRQVVTIHVAKAG
ncbi:MAG TPA: molybdopterin-dependent oxidoreductase [Tepidisphaeraceae bacterium]|nr:molybdopterin-dependent oxidoreductase [Tepidisphaeraceae bacterium]